MSSEKHNTMTPAKRFWSLLKPDAKEIRNVYIYAVFGGLISLSLPLGIQAIVNLIQGGSVNSSWVVLIIFVVFGVTISGIMQLLQLRITEDLKQKIFSRAAFDFAYRIPKIKLEELYKKYAPELMNRFFDIIAVQKGLSKILMDFSTALIQMIFGLLLLSFYHPFFIIFSVVLLALILFIIKLTAKKGLETSILESKYKYKVVHWLEELARSSNTFKLAGESDLILQKTDDWTGKYLKAREGHFKVLMGQYSLLIVFKVLVVAGLLAIGGVLVMEQMMNLGQFVAAEIVILLVINAVEKLVLNVDVIYDVLTSLEKVGQVVDLEIEKDGGRDLSIVTDNEGLKVEVSNVSFSYPNCPRSSFHSVDLKVEKGEKVLLKGNPGEGKSVLLKLIAGMYSPLSGQIIINDSPLKAINLMSYRNEIGICFPEESLFNGTIIENVTLGRSWITYDDVNNLVKKAGISETISSLPEGLDTMVGPENTDLSAYVVKAILLLRALAGKPKLLLLEYAFDDVSKKTQDKLLSLVFNKINSFTVIMISRSGIADELVDKVYQVENDSIKLITV